MYWLDASRHPGGRAYVYTLDQDPLHRCRICPPEADPHFFNKREAHLKLRHKVRVKNEQELGGYFSELSAMRPFPIKPYMPPIIDTWLRDQIVLVEKSRDVMATWLMVALYSWDTFFHSGRQNVFQSKDAPKTLELVRRAYFIWRNQPKFLRSCKAIMVSGGTRSGALTIPAMNSEIVGFPQGPDQVRQLHPTGVFMDEAAYQVQAGDAFTAIKPAIQAGGRLTAISSANPGWFFLAASDMLDEEE